MEQWKDIKGFGEKYQVSNLGRIKRIACKSISNMKLAEMIVESKYNNRGYEQVHLNLNGKQDMKLVHRLVAEAFVPNKNGFKQVNHLDENKSNNNENNLEWCTNMYNRHYGTGIERMRLYRDYNAIIKNRNKKINQLDVNGNFIATWNNIAEAKKETGTNDTSISFCVRGKQQTAGGYKWEYAEVINE